MEDISFAPGILGNAVRGALGSILRSFACKPECPGSRTCDRARTCTYARIFEPSAPPGPSGFADPPRPFVIRAAHLEDARIPAGRPFSFFLNVFDTDPALWPQLAMTFAHLAKSGLGPERRRVLLTQAASVDGNGQPKSIFFADGKFLNPPLCDPLSISLAPTPANRIRVHFITPFELKGLADPKRPDFHAVFARARDRCGALCTLYGAGPLTINFRELGERSRAIQLTAASITGVSAGRTSSRTHQTHSVGGWIGTADYAGELGDFVPYVAAAKWTGIGRHTAWGNGELHVEWRV